MKKMLLVALAGLFLSACAGEPPKWWNPGNRYGTTAQQSAPTEQPVDKKPAARKVQEPQEEDLSFTQEDSLEELTVTPMPDEENENVTGLAASQNEELTPDGTLPAPSVLE